MKYYAIHFFVYLLLISSLILGFSSCKRTLKPELGDEFYLKTEDDKFTSYKVVEASRRSVWYVVSDYTVSEEIYVDSIFMKERYTDKPIKIKRKDFNKLPITYFKNKLKETN